MDQSGEFRVDMEARRTDPAPPGPPRRRKGDYPRLRLRLYLAIMLIDAASMSVAFATANLVRFGRPFESYGVEMVMLLLPVYLAIGLNGGAWSIDALASPRRSVGLAVRSLLLALAVATAAFFSLKIGEDFSRPVFGIGGALALALIALGRFWLGKAIGRRCGWSFRREALIVDQVEVQRIGTEIVIDAQREALSPVIDDPVMLHRLAGILGGCERVILSCPPERRAAWSRMLAGANLDVEILAPELAQVGALALRSHSGRPTLLIDRGPLGLHQRALKRGFDLAISALALLLLLPLLALIALAIRLESPGPAFFHQARMGRGNRLFHVLKFRTMRLEATDVAGARSAARDDKRVTRLGRLLRRTSLDELPQLINVLKGEMSLVGPRPHALGSTAEDAPFWTIDEHYWDRHAIKPGMTGLAQVRGLRGATHTRGHLAARLKADLEYLDGWHIGRDVAIVARTFLVMVHRNAY